MDPQDELLISFHRQFAENQNYHQRLFIQFVAAVFVVLVGYAMVYTKTGPNASFFTVSKNHNREIVEYSVVHLIEAYFAAQIILCLMIGLVANTGYNFRRDQMVNFRIRRLLSLFLLYQAGFEVGRFVSLERVIEESKETYYDSLHQSSQHWHEGEHDLRPWWNYFLGMLTAAYKEFESRVGVVTTARGAKRDMVLAAFERLPETFSFKDFQRACPGVSYPTLRRALDDLRKARCIELLGRGRDALWKKI